MKRIITGFLFLSLVTLSQKGLSQDYFPVSHREFDWETFESSYATVVYHDSLEVIARRAAAIYDSVYLPICQYYNYFPVRQTLIIKDTDDYSNGAAYFYDDKIEIWATSLDFDLRGSHSWLEDVISHEFTHIVQIQSAMKWSKRIPAIYLQVFGYEDIRRPDYLYGFPNTLVSFPFMNITIPAWLAEGTAQVNLPDFYHDFWDSHRDMILRARTLDGTLLSFNDMQSFNKTSLDGETVYNQGFHMVSYLIKRFGTDAPDRLNQSLKKQTVWTVKSALEDAFGIPADQLYMEWKADILNHYSKQIEPIKGEINNGEAFWTTGFSNWIDAQHPENHTLLIRSNQTGDYFSDSRLIIVDTVGTVIQSLDKIRPNKASQWVQLEGKWWILYSQIGSPNATLSAYSDLFLYDPQNKKQIQLTHSARLLSPAWDGEKYIYAIRSQKGQKQIVRFNLDDFDSENPDHFYPQIEVLIDDANLDWFNLTIDPAGRKLAADFVNNHGRQIAIINVETKDVQIITTEGVDSRYPRWIDQVTLAYSSDQSGIFNLYTHDLETGRTQQLSQVTGGVFHPFFIDQSQFLASTFTGYGYRIHRFNPVSILSKPNMSPFLPFEKEGFKANPIPQEKSTYPESVPARFSVRDEPLTWYPVIRIDGYTKQYGSYFDNFSNGEFGDFGSNMWRDFRIGSYFFSADPLDFMQISGAALIGPGTPSESIWDVDKDIFLDLNIADPLFAKHMPIRWGIDYYHVSRYTDGLNQLGPGGDFGVDSAIVDVTYGLNQFDLYGIAKIGPLQQLKLNYAFSFYSSKVGNFYWRPVQDIIPGDSKTYFKGQSLSLNYTFNLLKRTKESSIIPVGREISLTAAIEKNELLDDFGIDESKGVLIPLYKNYSVSRLSLGYKEHLALPFENQTLSGWIRRSTVYSDQVDEFFFDFVGGFTGMRGYEFYSLGGYELAQIQINYRFPIFTKVDRSIGFIGLERLYGSLFFDYGHAWTGTFPGLKSFKRDVGFELRFETSNFYLLPLRIFFSGAYGLDTFNIELREGFQTSSGRQTVAFGHEWKFYFGMLFDFDLGLE